MLRATLKGIVAHKLRLVLTAISISIGVGFVAGTFMFTDTIDAAFDGLFDDIFSNIDVEIGYESDTALAFVQSERLPGDLLAEIQAVEGVEFAWGVVTGYAQFIDRDGQPVTTGGAPTLGVSWSPRLDVSPWTLRAGRAPVGPFEVVIDAATAARLGFSVGDDVEILFEGPKQTFVIVGVAGFGDAASPGGATGALFELPVAQRLLGAGDTLDTIEVLATDDISAQDLADRLSAFIPEGATAVTGSDAAASQAGAIKDQLGVLNIILLVFAAIAVFVGAFIIQNTFRIIVAQRTRELGLLRVLGATGAQLTRVVVVEAFVVGLISSVVGIGVGVGLAFGIRGAFTLIGASFPPGAMQILPRTIVVAMVLGVGVTVISALLPARRASRISPMQALDGVGGRMTPRSLGIRALIGGVVSAIGVAAVLVGLFFVNELQPVGAGAGLIFIGVAILSPVFARPVTRFIGRPIAALGGVSGRLGRDNAARLPRRTSATAAALMIGVTLVTAIAILASSFKATVGSVISDSFRADFVIQQPGGAFGQITGIPPEVADRVGALDEIEAVGRVRFNLAKIDGSTVFIGGIDANWPDMFAVDVIAGSFSDLSGSSLAVSAAKARTDGLNVGDVVTIDFARTGAQSIPIVALFEADGVAGPYLLSLDAFRANFVERLDQGIYVKAAVPPADALAAIQEITDEYPTAAVLNAADIRQEAEDQVDQLLSAIIALLMLAVVVSLVGITNTLSLSVIERTREIGMLRAVGMGRRAVRAMVRWESVVIAIFGALLGIVLGIALAWAVVRALADDGLRFALPAGQVVAVVIGAGAAGVMAAVFPARRAARLDILEAIAYE